MPEISPKDIRDLVGTDSPTILEIGCNDGTDSLAFLQAMPGARIYCFEPDPRAIERFKSQVQNPQITLTEAAIADLDGTATFHGSSGRPPNVQPNSSHYCFLDEWDLSGSLYEPAAHLQYSPWVTFPENRQYSVPVLRLDTWNRTGPRLSQIDFIWIDTQGGEASVLLGATETLSHTRYLYTEYYDRPLYSGQVSLEALKAILRGWQFLHKYNDNALFKRL